MKKIIFNAVLDHIGDSVENLDEFKHYKKMGYNGHQLVQNGFFLCYYSDVFHFLSELYGSDFDATRYVRKDGSRKYKNGEVYCWTVYKHLLGYVINKIT